MRIAIYFSVFHMYTRSFIFHYRIIVYNYTFNVKRYGKDCEIFVLNFFIPTIKLLVCLFYKASKQFLLKFSLCKSTKFLLKLCKHFRDVQSCESMLHYTQEVKHKLFDFPYRNRAPPALRACQGTQDEFLRSPIQRRNPSKFHGRNYHKET